MSIVNCRHKRCADPALTTLNISPLSDHPKLSKWALTKHGWLMDRLAHRPWNGSPQHFHDRSLTGCSANQAHRNNALWESESDIDRIGYCIKWLVNLDREPDF